MYVVDLSGHIPLVHVFDANVPMTGNSETLGSLQPDSKGLSKRFMGRVSQTGPCKPN